MGWLMIVTLDGHRFNINNQNKCTYFTLSLMHKETEYNHWNYSLICIYVILLIGHISRKGSSLLLENCCMTTLEYWSSSLFKPHLVRWMGSQLLCNYGMEFLIQERQICDRIKIQAYIIVEEIFCCFAEDVSRENEKMEHHIKAIGPFR